MYNTIACGHLSRFKNSYLSYMMMYCFYYLSWALFSAFISVYLMGKGYNAAEVSLVVSASYLASMVSQPYIGVLNDNYGYKRVNSIMFALAGMGGLGFLISDNLITLLISYSFVLLIINGSNPVIEKVATVSPFEYGKVRVWGTIGYALGTQIAGVLYEKISPKSIFVAFVFTMMLCVAGLLGTDADIQRQEQESKKDNSALKELASNRKYLYFLVILGLFIGVSNFGNTYIPTMLTNDGLSEQTASTILSIAVLCEAPLVFFAGRFMDRLSNKKLMMIAFGMVVFQFATYAFSISLPFKILGTFVAKHPAGMLFIMIKLKVIATIIDEKMQIMALAFAMTIQNLTSILFNNAGGILLDAFGYRSTCMIGLAMLMVGFVLLAMYRIPSGNDKRLFST
ncbi:MAG: MFS transporter [Lachnospiraceae bacterium]|nr:MFS transporter [Lachnospiraceae bacterium]